MRWLVLLGALSACETTPFLTTSLDGGIACGPNTCGDNEVCVENAAGIDAAAGGGASTSCFAVPKGCYIFDCAGARCAPCIQDLCSLVPVEVSVRNVYCPGQ